MAGDAVNFLTPIGRLVQGDCFEAQTKDGQGNPLIYTRGPKIGQPKINYFIAAAFAKNDPAWPAFRAILDSTARRDFPHLFPGGGACTKPDFAFKVIDGDGVDDNHVQNNTKEGFAGHWVIRFSTSYPPKCFAAGKYQPHEQLQAIGGVNPIPKGYMIRVAGTVKGNDTTDKPGLYISHNMIEFAAVGPLITSGPSASAVFGGGGGAAPVAGAPVLTAKAAGQTYAGLIAAGWTDATLLEHGMMLPPVAAPIIPPPPAAFTPPPSIAPPPPAAAAPPPPVTPHTGILSGGPVLTAKAEGQTYAQLIQAGWTDALLLEHGMMLPAVTPPPLASGGSAPPPPPAPTAVAPPPPPAGKRMLPAAGATTYEQYIAGGWTDAQLVQNGFMAA